MFPTVLVIAAVLTPILGLDRCDYMTAIPRQLRPDNFPREDYTGMTWNERPFLPVEDRDDLCMGIYMSNTQLILMDEEIAKEITIAKLNYQGTVAPIAQFLSGSSLALGAEFRSNNGEWDLVITQKQDYESLPTAYMFTVVVEGETLRPTISLQIVNIDDNPPIIRSLGNCVVPELGEVPRLTDCIYEVSDEDGLISTSVMTFSISSDSGQEEIFFLHKETTDDEKIVLMVIGLYQQLDYIQNALHIFQATAVDSAQNNSTATVMVQVENVEHRPPRWVEIFAVQQFDEKTAMAFPVRAIDGDTGINNPICYKLDGTEDRYFSIELPETGDGAILVVEPINRDAIQQEVFQLVIIAYKCNNESLAAENSVVIIINDINDQWPLPLASNYTVDILEETPMTLPFGDDFGFYDRDQVQNAQYSVHLEDISPIGAATAFQVAPVTGFQRQTFIMSTVNHSMLDYEDPEFQNIELKMVATDLGNPEFIGEAILYINLINWNDEEPIFEESSKVVSFLETVEAGYNVTTLPVHDRDIDDVVIYSILGNAVDYLSIDSAGEILVTANNSFDYARQNELFVQVRAEDTLGEPYHTTTSQLTIQLIDVNNVPPTLRLPRSSPSIEENVPAGTLVTDEITATDVDSDAELVFDIIWENSYATKQGRNADVTKYQGCMTIETVFPDPTRRGAATGVVTVQEIDAGVTIDFEEFEVLYLSIRVTDLNTEIGEEYDELTFTVNIIDMNDNAPIFTSDPNRAFRVREVSASDTVIGSVLATDIDGPLYNQIEYSITPRNGTAEGLVKIDPFTGQISVDTHGAIDADTPRQYYLYYTVVASDECTYENEEECPPDDTAWRTEEEIEIYITDTNNKIPYAMEEEFETVIEIYENATSGDEVVRIVANDLDRDELYHTVRYQIVYTYDLSLRNFFEIDLDTGDIRVNYTTEETLDRDNGQPEHRIFVRMIDNLGMEGGESSNQNETEVLVRLLDVNDNAPELESPSQLSWTVSEGLLQGQLILPMVEATDKDDPETDNARIGFRILGLTKVDPPGDLDENLFIIHTNGNFGQLETAVDLQGYWGTYDIVIEAYDHGIPPLSSNETYQLTITPYNFHDPVFVFPAPDSTVRLAREGAQVGAFLTTVAGQYLDRISATDEDGLEAGQVTFSIVGDDEAMGYFEVSNEELNFGSLRLTQTFTESIREFQVTIRATDQGTDPGPRSSDVTLRVVFVPTQGEPTFSVPTAAVSFEEATLEGSQQLPLADDAKNYLCEEDCFTTYYRIVDGNADGHFSVEALTNTLTLARVLDRNTTDSYQLIIAASNSMEAVASLQSSLLSVTVTVLESDPKPVFVRQLYTAGISTADSIDKELLTVQATHSKDLQITYSIDSQSMVVDSSLEAVKERAFSLDAASGQLTLSIQPTASMHGMFEFDIVATDEAEETSSTQVKIYLISSRNRVYFRFMNTLQEIEENREFIRDTFSTGFQMTCNIDEIVQASDSSGISLENQVEVRTHFIRDDIPVPNEEIEQLRSDTQLLLSVQLALNTRLLTLQDFFTDSSPVADPDNRQMMVYILAALAAILAFMLVILLVAYVIKTKTLNRRIEALAISEKRPSMLSTDLRVNTAAPGTNKHAVLGSNPIWNEQINAPNFDTLSDTSDDSDLIGIEDLPQFRTDYFPPADTNSVDGVMGGVANHGNNFGFNTTPFSTQFGNNRYSNI